MGDIEQHYGEETSDRIRNDRRRHEIGKERKQPHTSVERNTEVSRLQNLVIRGDAI